MAGKRSAVVVGINKYNDPKISPELRGAENDAREVFARLQKFGSFELDKSRHLLLGKDANSENVRRAISELFWKKDPCDIVMFYFSGHGFLDDYGNGYIAPWDHEYEDPFVRGIRMQELRQYFLANNNKTEALLILDCCHSGVTAETKKGDPEMRGRFYDSLTSNQPTVLGNGKFILASSGADEKSREMNAAHQLRILDKKQDGLEFDDLEKHDHGVMTYYLLEGMNGGAAEADAVKIGRLYDYVKTKVNAYQLDGNKDFKIYDTVCSTYEEGPASQTVLVRAPSKHKIDELIRQATDEINDTCDVPQRDTSQASSGRYPLVVVYPASLLEAIRYVDEALELSPETPQATAFVNTIDARLADYRPYLSRWLLTQKRDYLDRKYRDEFSLLEKVMNNLCFERLRKLEVEQGNLLIDLIRLSLGDDDLRETFNDGLLRAPFTRAQKKSGSAGDPTAVKGPS